MSHASEEIGVGRKKRPGVTPESRAPRTAELQAVGDPSRPRPGIMRERDSDSDLRQRIDRLERRVRMQYFGLLLLALTGVGVIFSTLVTEDVIVRQKLMESRELTLLDNDGNARLFLRMYSKVPVLQIMDSNGRPRMSLGLRFDDTPFLDLSDKRGRTRATFEMTEEDSPALRLFDENGATTFNIN